MNLKYSFTLFFDSDSDFEKMNKRKTGKSMLELFTIRNISFPCGIRNNGLLPGFAALQINSSKSIRMQKNVLFRFSIHFHIFPSIFFFFCFDFFRSCSVLLPRSALFCSDLLTHWNHNVSKTSCLSFSFYCDIPLAMWHLRHTISTICNQNC